MGGGDLKGFMATDWISVLKQKNKTPPPAAARENVSVQPVKNIVSDSYKIRQKLHEDKPVQEPAPAFQVPDTLTKKNTSCTVAILTNETINNPMATLPQVKSVKSRGSLHNCTDFWENTEGQFICRLCHPPVPGAEKIK